jgi:hypothetical protein
MFTSVHKLAYLSGFCRHLFVGVHSGSASTAALLLPFKAVCRPGLKAVELPGHAMAQLLLGKCADKTEHVILKPRPVRASGKAVWWEMVDIRQFAQGLIESTL